MHQPSDLASQRGRDPFLRVEAVTRRYGTFRALDEVSLDVHRGELVCLLGPSGCGKTTLLRIVAGLERQDEGRVIQAGQDVSTWPPARRDFGIVFQSYALFPNLTIAQNVGYGLTSRSLPAKETRRRVGELLDLVGLADQGHKYPAQLSGGQQQRVALARALALSPGLLLLDEPLSALDARVRAGLRTEITSLQRRLELTTLLVTHDQEEALTMADRIVVMDRGRIVQVGPPREVYSRPATPFVADFVGRMNFLPGVVTDDARVRCGDLVLGPAGSPNGYRPGSRVTLAIRPEEVRILDGGAGPPAAVPAVVDEVEFLGPFCRLRLTVPRAAGARLVADVAPDTALAGPAVAGRTVGLHLPSEHLRVFPAAAR